MNRNEQNHNTNFHLRHLRTKLLGIPKTKTLVTWLHFDRKPVAIPPHKHFDIVSPASRNRPRIVTDISTALQPARDGRDPTSANHTDLPRRLAVPSSPESPRISVDVTTGAESRRSAPARSDGTGSGRSTCPRPARSVDCCCSALKDGRVGSGREWPRAGRVRSGVAAGGSGQVGSGRGRVGSGREWPRAGRVRSGVAAGGSGQVGSGRGRVGLGRDRGPKLVGRRFGGEWVTSRSVVA